MNLNKGMKELIIDRFKTGASIAEIAAWYGKKPEQIEKVIREYLNDDKQIELVSVPPIPKGTVESTERLLSDGRKATGNE